MRRERRSPACSSSATSTTRPAAAAPARPLHDPRTIAYLLRPELFAGRDCHVAIETAGEHTTGRTVVDWSARSGRPPNAKVIHQIDAD
jgi:inosine-uridine nucleoside N-ribohydrolase